MLKRLKCNAFGLFLIPVILSLYSGSVSATGLPSPAQASPHIPQTVVPLLPPPGEGCWQMNSTEQKWMRATCAEAPSYRHEFKRAEYYNTGGGFDYSALTSLVTFSAEGSFPVATGIKYATSDGQPGDDIYSLQLNTNYSDSTPDGFVRLGNTSPYCSHHHYNACSTWQQFAYLKGFIFIQNWLFIGTDDRCPAEWNDQGAGRGIRSCWKNSDAMKVSDVPVADLGKITLHAQSANGLDTIIFTDNKGRITATSQKQDTLEIRSTWRQSEFNVFSLSLETTKFNPGVSLTVRLVVDDGTTHTPKCHGPVMGGMTAESTNLNLGKCTPFSGLAKGIEFTQAN